MWSVTIVKVHKVTLDFVKFQPYWFCLNKHLENLLPKNIVVDVEGLMCGENSNSSFPCHQKDMNSKWQRVIK